jgi:hypothetical protein
LGGRLTWSCAFGATKAGTGACSWRKKEVRGEREERRGGEGRGTCEAGVVVGEVGG